MARSIEMPVGTTTREDMMIQTRFLQFHTLHSYPAALLNRDASGLAKKLTFGGHVRTRVS